MATDNNEENTMNSDNKEPTETTVATETTPTEEPIRVRVQAPDVAEVKKKVQKFTSAQGANFHLGVQKAKRVSLTALHKVATWLTPKNRQ